VRETPQYIDRSAKALEYLAAFLVPSILSFPLLELKAVIVGVVVCGLTIKFTAGKPPGFIEGALYKIGMPMMGLLPRRLKRLERG